MGVDVEVEARLALLCDEAARVGGDVVVASGDGPVPPTLADRRNLTWLEDPVAGLFALRRKAVAVATGEVIVISEDHCAVEPGWLGRVLASHARLPDADVVVGRVVNGTDATPIDRAAFYVSLAPLVAPIDTHGAWSQVPVAGASLKRRAVDRLVAACPDLPLELVPGATLEALGLCFVVDETLSVAHLQSGGWRFHAALHFHNARAVSGSPWHRRRARTWARLLAAPLLVGVRVARTLRQVHRKHVPLAAVLALGPGVAWLYGVKSAGEWAGALLGAGGSARLVR